MRLGMSYKINGFIFISVLSITIVLSAYFYQLLSKENREHSIHTLKTSHYAVHSILDTEALLKIKPGSYKTTEYKKEWDKINDLEKQLGLKYVYVLILNEAKQPVFVFDSGDNAGVFSLKNHDELLSRKFSEWSKNKDKTDLIFQDEIISYYSVYTDAPREAYLAIESKDFSLAKEYTDKWGTFLSAFSPIVHNGQVIGLVGADYEISYIKNLEKSTLYVILYILLFAFFLNLIIGFLIRQIFIRPILSLAESSKQIAEGNLNTKLKIRDSFFEDEVSDLFLNFSFMSSKLSENFSRIENYSKEIERLSKTKDEFLANLSHELKTPLSIVYAYAEMLQMDESYPEEVKDYSQEIYASAQKLNDYVSDVILVTDIESNVTLEKSNVFVPDLILSSIKQLKSFSEAKKIQWELNLKEYTQISCDSILLEKAIFAISKNAIIYNNLGGKVIIEVETISSQVQIKIKDTGIGIAQEFQEKVFEKFFRIDSSLTYEVSGVGVGLFIAKKIVELHKGTIELNSALGEGATITIKMPMLPDS